MAIQNISNSVSSLSNVSKVKFSSNNETLEDNNRREIVREKREEADRIIKKTYYKGLFMGALVTATVGLADLITNHYLDKKSAKDADELRKSILKDTNVPMEEIEQLTSNGLKDAQTPVKNADEFHIPIISTIKKAVSRIKK